MAFRQRVQGATAEPPGARVATAREDAQPCGTLARVLARVFRRDKPEILDLGPLCGDSVVYLAGRGARVHVEDFQVPDPIPARKPGEPPAEIEPVRLDQPDDRFDLVLVWETFDFVPPERLVELGAEIRRVVRDGGTVVIFSSQKPGTERENLPRYRVLADDLIAREPRGGTAVRRYAHPTREIERAISGLAVQGIHLQRNQMREIVAVKPGIG